MQLKDRPDLNAESWSWYEWLKKNVRQEQLVVPGSGSSPISNTAETDQDTEYSGNRWYLQLAATHFNCHTAIIATVLTTTSSVKRENLVEWSWKLIVQGSVFDHLGEESGQNPTQNWLMPGPEE